jgi:hypothetical protein
MAFIRRYLIFLVFGFSLLGGVLARAQLPLSPADPPPPSFRVVSLSGVVTFLFDIDKKKEVLSPGAGSFSRLYPAPKNRTIVFYQETPASDPKLPPAKTPVARATLPAEKSGPFLIVLAPGAPGAELPFNTLVIDHSLEAHPVGSYRVFNFSKRRLAVNLADVKMVLAPGEHGAAPYPAAKKGWLQVAAEENQSGWLLVSSSPHPVGIGCRTTVFLVDIAPSPQDPDPKGIIVRRINESTYADAAGALHLR